VGLGTGVVIAPWLSLCSFHKPNTPRTALGRQEQEPGYHRVIISKVHWMLYIARFLSISLESKSGLFSPGANRLV